MPSTEKKATARLVAAMGSTRRLWSPFGKSRPPRRDSQASPPASIPVYCASPAKKENGEFAR